MDDKAKFDNKNIDFTHLYKITSMDILSGNKRISYKSFLYLVK